MHELHVRSEKVLLAHAIKHPLGGGTAHVNRDRKTELARGEELLARDGQVKDLRLIGPVGGDSERSPPR